MLAATITGLTNRAGNTMNTTNASFSFILMLATFSTGSKRLPVAIVFSHTKK
jgi:hypothetical protein